jgi:hypothetical protein
VSPRLWYGLTNLAQVVVCGLCGPRRRRASYILHRAVYSPGRSSKPSRFKHSGLLKDTIALAAGVY